MIRKFWVENYLSIRERQTLSFIAKSHRPELVSEVADGVLINKLGIFYGHNASGKSNILWAINQAFRLLVTPKVSADEKVSGYYPFALTKDQPSKLYVSFYAEGIRYDYEVTFNGDHILHELLLYYPKGSKSLFYERSYVGDGVQADIKFGVSLHLQAKTSESIRQNTLNNHSVLAVCQKNTFKEDIAPFVTLHRWVLNYCHEADGVRYRNDNVAEVLKSAFADPKKYSFFSEMLKRADLNINDFRPTEESAVFSSADAQNAFEVPLRNQSTGTLTYIRVLDKLYDMVTGDHIYILDEFGESLHGDLLYFFLEVFFLKSHQSQLFITSQETSVLSQEMLNECRGSVWFVEKNAKTASSKYARGDSYGLHKNLSLFNSYRTGRFGARANIGEPEFDF